MPLYKADISHPGYLTGSYFYTTWPGQYANTAIAAIDVIYFYMFQLFKPITFTGGRINVSTGGAGSSIKGGIYADSPVSHRPLGAPLFVDNTGVSTASSSTTVTLAIGSGTLGSGFYWIGCKATGTLPTVTSTVGSNLNVPFMSGTKTQVYNSSLTYSDTYSNNMPTIAEGSGSLTPAVTTCPLLFLAT